MTHEETTSALENDPELPSSDVAALSALPPPAGETPAARPLLPPEPVQGDSELKPDLRSECCGAGVDLLASVPLCVRCNGMLVAPRKGTAGKYYEAFPGRHYPGHNERCGLKWPNPPRDLAAVIDAMLAEIPEAEVGMRSDLLCAQHSFVDQGEREPLVLVKVVKALIRPGILTTEPWYERVMAIWSGEEIAAAILSADTEVAQAILDAPDPPFSPAIAGEAWAFEEHDVADLAKERIDAPMPPETWCADCGGQPQLILLAQDCAKCVRCFLLAGMNSRCFACGKNPTEAIVRAIHPIDGKDDTVGVCVDCLLKHVSAGRN